MSDDVFRCSVTSSGQVSWAVNLPVELASYFRTGNVYRIALDDEDIDWKVPRCFHGQTPSGCKCRHIITRNIRDWLRRKGRSSPIGNVYMRYVGHDRFRLGCTRREVDGYRKKDTEHLLLEEFMSVLGLAPQSVRSGEAPDFIVHIQGRTIAIELTEFHADRRGADGRPRRAIEKDWQDIQQRIRHQRTNRPPLQTVDALLHFKRLEVPRRRDHVRFVDELLGFVEDVSPRVTDSRCDFSEFDTDRFPLLSHYVRGIDLWRPSCVLFNWSWNQSASSVGLSESELLKALRSKLEAARPTGVDEYWILVVASTGLQQAMGPVTVDQLRQYCAVCSCLGNGPADKVYIYQYYGGNVFTWEAQRGWH